MSPNSALLRLTSWLIARRDMLRKTIKADLYAVRNTTASSAVGDAADAAIDSANDEIWSQLVEIESHELAQVEHALDRLAVGAYGRCEICGNRIPAARRVALPSTTRCLDCQRQTERNEGRRDLKRGLEQWPRAAEKPIEECRRETEPAVGELEINFSDLDRHTLRSLLL